MLDSSLVVRLGVPMIAVLVSALVAFGIHRAAPRELARARTTRFVTVLGAWALAVCALAWFGVFARSDVRPPPPLFLMLTVMTAPILALRTKAVTDLVAKTPIALLVGFHAFRLPLELVMHEASVEGVMPPQMTYTGWNFDILTGVSAMVVGALAAMDRAPTWLLFAWNAVGTALLFTIGAIAVSSLPAFAAFGSDPAHVNTWVLYFPHVMLPAVLVAAAWFGHLVLWRRLLSGAATQAARPT